MKLQVGDLVITARPIIDEKYVGVITDVGIHTYGVRLIKLISHKYSHSINIYKEQTFAKEYVRKITDQESMEYL